jgi:signal peptidase
VSQARTRHGHLLSYAVLALAIFATMTTIAFGLREAFNVSTPLVVVEGNSMIPTLYNGDLVFITKPQPDKITIGDIIVYESPATGRLVIHRVVRVYRHVSMHGLEYYYVTKGDNNPVDDVAQGLEPPGGIPYRDILGVVVSVNLTGTKAPLRVPYLGLVTSLLRR